jgi:hypothetical protein
LSLTESERSEYEPDEDDGEWRSASSAVDDVRGMFDGLQSHLGEN